MILWEAALLLGWLALAGPGLQAVIAGLVAAALAAAAPLAVAWKGHPQAPPPRFDPILVRRALWLPWQVLIDTGKVMIALARSLAGHAPVGRFVREPLPPHARDRQAIGARAFVVAAGSLAPNGYVLGIDREALLVHRLLETDRQGEDA